MRYVTAIFGEKFRRMGRGLIRSFAAYCPNDELHVYTDLDGIDGERADMDELVGAQHEFYRHRHRRNVFKFELIRRQLEHDETVCWIDADSLVLANLADHLKERVVNVVAHGAGGKLVDYGGELTIPVREIAVGGLFTMTRRGLEFAKKIMRDRLEWNHRRYDSGDQVIITHLAHRSNVPLVWVDQSEWIFGLDVCRENGHPRVGSKGLRDLCLGGDGVYSGGRRIAFFYWTSRTLRRHFNAGFSASFARPVARLLEGLYR